MLKNSCHRNWVCCIHEGLVVCIHFLVIVAIVFFFFFSLLEGMMIETRSIFRKLHEYSNNSMAVQCNSWLSEGESKPSERSY